MNQSRIIISILSALTAITLVGCGATFAKDSGAEPTLDPITISATDTASTMLDPEPIKVDIPEPSIKADGTLVAYSFDQAEKLCLEQLEGQEQEDCIDGALSTWCMYEPLTPESEYFTEEDARCLAEQLLMGEDHPSNQMIDAPEFVNESAMPREKSQD